MLSLRIKTPVTFKECSAQIVEHARIVVTFNLRWETQLSVATGTFLCFVVPFSLLLLSLLLDLNLRAFYGCLLASTSRFHDAIVKNLISFCSTNL